MNYVLLIIVSEICFYFPHPGEEDWGDDEEEWEWEEDDDVEEEEEQQQNPPEKCNGLNHDNEDEDEDDDNVPRDAKGVPDIKIQGSVLKIDRKNVDWSDDEYDESPPPLPPSDAAIPAPPPMPPPLPGTSSIIPKSISNLTYDP